MGLQQRMALRGLQVFGHHFGAHLIRPSHQERGEVLVNQQIQLADRVIFKALAGRPGDFPSRDCSCAYSSAAALNCG